jgi:hypothetical protein
MRAGLKQACGAVITTGETARETMEGKVHIQMEQWRSAEEV